MKIFDAHIHLFEKPYSNLYNNSHIKEGEEGELHLYEECRKKFNIIGAFVVCYEDGHCPENNSYVEFIKKEREWIYSFGYIRLNPDEMETNARKIMDKGHLGISCYLDKDDTAIRLSSPKIREFWKFLEEKQIPISFNLSAFHCKSLYQVLKHYLKLIIIISHMARPKVTAGKLSEKDYAPLLSLAKFNNVYVKLSGFYAFAKEGWRYPQSELFCVIDILKENFTAKRLLFASDFSPVLEFNTFQQTVELLRKEYRGFTEDELEDIYWGNAYNLTKLRR